MKIFEYKGIIIHSKDPLVEISDGLKEISKKL
jgi:hypothetical protein